MLRTRLALLCLTTPMLLSLGCIRSTSMLAPRTAAGTHDLGAIDPVLDFDKGKPTTTRPFSDWQDVQVLSVLWNGDSPNRDDYSHFAEVDLLGTAQKMLIAGGAPAPPAVVTGTVKERALKDGTCEVTVEGHFQNVFAKMRDLDIDPPMNLVFGYSVAEIVADHSLQPGLASGSFSFKFINDAPGAPLPSFSDLVFQPAYAGRLESVHMSASGFGPCRAALGVPEGTRGKLTVTQVGLHLDNLDHYHNADWEGFPCGVVKVQALGGN